MSRPIEFDKGIALGTAMDLFWRQGFRAASIDDLTASMGISRSSLYHSFGNKQDVLNAAISQYAEAQAKRLQATLRSGSLRSGLRRLFKAIAEDNNGGRGCLLGNCAVELGPHDAAIAGRVRDGFAAQVDVLKRRIEKAQQHGEVDAHRSALELANYLAASITGLRVLAKTRIDHRTLAAVGEMTIASVLLPEANGRRPTAGGRRRRRQP